jgi:hypothetical protein
VFKILSAYSFLVVVASVAFVLWQLAKAVLRVFSPKRPPKRPL